MHDNMYINNIVIIIKLPDSVLRFLTLSGRGKLVMENTIEIFPQSSGDQY